jgi:hypothetical protein
MLTQAQRIRAAMAAYQVTQDELIEKLGWKYPQVLIVSGQGGFEYSEASETAIMDAIREIAEGKQAA